MNRLTQRLETWAWVCLYGGLLLGSWSLFVSASAGYALWAMRGIAVDVFTRTDSEPSTIEVEPGVRVRTIADGGIALAVMEDPEPFDLVHSHYWLSGQIGLVAAGRLGVPLVHTMHTMGRVKNLSLAAGDHAESAARIGVPSDAEMSMPACNRPQRGPNGEVSGPLTGQMREPVPFRTGPAAGVPALGDGSRSAARAARASFARTSACSRSIARTSASLIGLPGPYGKSPG